MSPPKRSAQATVVTTQKDLLPDSDKTQEMRIKLLQLAHAHGRTAKQSIEIAAELEEYVLIGKPKGPVEV